LIAKILSWKELFQMNDGSGESEFAWRERLYNWFIDKQRREANLVRNTRRISRSSIEWSKVPACNFSGLNLRKPEPHLDFSFWSTRTSLVLSFEDRKANVTESRVSVQLDVRQRMEDWSPTEMFSADLPFSS
jgi:hypothetical protein